MVRYVRVPEMMNNNNDEGWLRSSSSALRTARSRIGYAVNSRFRTTIPDHLSSAFTNQPVSLSIFASAAECRLGTNKQGVYADLRFTIYYLLFTIYYLLLIDWWINYDTIRLLHSTPIGDRVLYLYSVLTCIFHILGFAVFLFLISLLSFLVSQLEDWINHNHTSAEFLAGSGLLRLRIEC